MVPSLAGQPTHNTTWIFDTSALFENILLNYRPLVFWMDVPTFAAWGNFTRNICLLIWYCFRSGKVTPTRVHLQKPRSCKNQHSQIDTDSLSKFLSGFILLRFIGRFLTQSLPPSWQLEQRIKTNNFQFTQTLSHASLFTHLRHFFCGKNPWGQNCEQSKIRPVSSFNLVGFALVKYCFI